VGTLSIALELRGMDFTSIEEMKNHLHSRFEYLLAARPTAVNIAESAMRFVGQISIADPNGDVNLAKSALVGSMEAMLEEDLKDNQIMGRFGSEEIAKHLNGKKAIVLTHCNTGSLATGGYGTALGVIRNLHGTNLLDHVYCTETRPYNQGARLTAYELVHEQIPATLICDSMAALLMKEKKIDAVVVGADRIVSNGDVANKIGTFQLAITAKYHSVPFYVAAPVSTIDFNLQEGSHITIEERPSSEMFCTNGKRVAAEGIGCWNPAFDVTPAALITGGIVTEKGVFAADNLVALQKI
jgi:methylthioribose-1-phosphate isomerase